MIVLWIVGCVLAPPPEVAPPQLETTPEPTSTPEPDCTAVWLDGEGPFDCEGGPPEWDWGFEHKLACCGCDRTYCGPGPDCDDSIQLVDWVLERCIETNAPLDPSPQSEHGDVSAAWSVAGQIVRVADERFPIDGTEPVGIASGCGLPFQPTLQVHLIDSGGHDWVVGWRVPEGLDEGALDALTEGAEVRLEVGQYVGPWIRSTSWRIHDPQDRLLASAGSGSPDEVGFSVEVGEPECSHVEHGQIGTAIVSGEATEHTLWGQGQAELLDPPVTVSVIFVSAAEVTESGPAAYWVAWRRPD